MEPLPVWPQQWLVGDAMFRGIDRYMDPDEADNILCGMGNLYRIGTSTHDGTKLEDHTMQFLSDVRRHYGKANWKFLCRMERMHRTLFHRYRMEKGFIEHLRLVGLEGKMLTKRSMALVSHWGVYVPYVVPMLRKMVEWVHHGRNKDEKGARQRQCMNLWDYVNQEIVVERENERPRFADLHVDDQRALRQWARGSLANAIRTSEEWHQHVHERRRAREIERTRELEARAAKMFKPQHREYEDVQCGVVFTPLSADELHAEGKKMHHCVGGYTTQVAMRNVYIFHAEAKDGEQATVEITRDMSVRQCCGPCNKDSSSNMYRAARNLVGVLMEERKMFEEGRSNGK
jgi:hypothetical protein